MKEYPEWQQRRIKAKKEGSLPYSFNYKIRRAFYGKPCPICGCKMRGYVDDGIGCDIHKASINHNLPISMGGKNDIDNISVICHQCNISRNKGVVTGKLNNDEVKEIWKQICDGTLDPFK